MTSLSGHNQKMIFDFFIAKATNVVKSYSSAALDHILTQKGKCYKDVFFSQNSSGMMS